MPFSHLWTSATTWVLIVLLCPAALWGQTAGSDSIRAVDLSDGRVATPDERQSTSVLARPWYQNVDIDGFGAFGFVDSGDDGTRPHGGFQVKEATLHVEFDAWEDVAVFVELQTNRLGDDKSKFVRTGEVYGHFRDLVRIDDVSVGLKVGRIDLPFGEEYLWQDAPDNPLISTSASYPYGWDEGVLIYGELHGVGWIAAVTDGTDERSVEDDPSKAINLKLWGDPLQWLSLSGSFMSTGKVGKSAFEFGGSHFQPVGASHSSSLGESTSPTVSASLYEATAQADGRRGHIFATYGTANQRDDAPAFDRDLEWYTVEGLAQAPRGVYGVVRFSEIRTSDANVGFHFDGKPTAGGNGAFGYDAQALRRISAGGGWDPTPRIRLKVEVGRDRFLLVPASDLTSTGQDRTLFGVELALRF